MRLFVAILLSEPVKDMLMQTIRQLQPSVLDGRFSRRENLHLTLAFLGESSLKPAQQALHQLSAPSFAMTVEGVGRFRRDGGDILWAGVRKNPDLSALAQQVQLAFSQKGFSLEKRPFAAHLTLGRQVLLPEGFNLKAFSKTLPASSMQVERVSLMKSERINGRLTYTEMDFVGLNKNREQK